MRSKIINCARNMKHIKVHMHQANGHMTKCRS